MAYQNRRSRSGGGGGGEGGGRRGGRGGGRAGPGSSSRDAPRKGGAGRPPKFSPGPWDAGPKTRKSESARPPISKVTRTRAYEDKPPRIRGSDDKPRKARGPDRVLGRQPLPRLETDTLVYGVRSVASLVEADPRRVARLFVEESRMKVGEVRELVDAAEDAGIRVTRVASEELAFLSRGAVHQGVLAEVAPFEFVGPEKLVGNSGPAMVLVLDEVTDPQNLGAAARAAWALGATGLLLPKDRAAPVNAAAEKVAAGALAHLKVSQVTNLARSLEQLKARGLWIIGLDSDGELPIWRQDLTMPLALVIGNEGRGMRRLTRDMCDAVVQIPMAQDGAALNAADAAAVALYEASRQRAESGGADILVDDDDDDDDE